MKYKIGDKIKMMKLEYLFGHDEFYEKYDYILTIEQIDGEYYKMKEDPIFWCKEDDIQCSLKEYEEWNYTPINSRFEILDL